MLKSTFDGRSHKQLVLLSCRYRKRDLDYVDVDRRVTLKRLVKVVEKNSENVHDVDAVYLSFFLILFLFQLDSNVGANLIFVNNYLNRLFVFIFEI